MLEEVWRALRGDEALVGRLEVAGPGRHLPARLDVDGLAVAAAGSALLAAAELTGAKRVSLDARHLAVAFASERHVAAEHEELLPGFAPLSRFARTADGWIRTHANYPHHRAALLRALGDPPDDEAALQAIGERG